MRIAVFGLGAVGTRAARQLASTDAVDEVVLRDISRARADEVRKEADMDRARQEDTLREADRIDPDVDHRADDYSPTTPPDQRTDETAGPA